MLSKELIQAIFPRTDYVRGREYFRQDRVVTLHEEGGSNEIQVSAQVQGTRKYQVGFRITSEGKMTLRCTCQRFRETERCKHLVAAMLEYLNIDRDADSSRSSRSSGGSDRVAQALLRRYLQKPQLQEPAQPVNQLEVRIHPGTGCEYPGFSLRVGREKMYVVKDVQEFLRRVNRREVSAYGKGLTLDHSMELFSQRDQALIRLLMNEFTEFRTLRGGYRLESYGYRKNEITLTGNAFDQWFDLLEGSQVEDMARKLWLLHTQEPQVRLRLEKGDNAAWLSVDTPVNYQFFGSRQALYAMGGGEMLRCSQAFRERVYPLLELRQPNMRISLEDLSLFCSYVLPEIGDLVEINDPQELLQSYIPDSCTLCFYLDIDQDALVLALRFRYDEKHSFTPEDVPKESDGVRRNLREEANGLQFALRYFQRQGNRLVLSGEEEIFDFLIGSLDAFRQRGEVYLSDRLQRQRIRPTAAVGISVSDGLLTLTLDTGDYPPEELSRLYQSMLQKRKYHRLTDGRYLELNGSACEKLAEMTQMLQLSDKELSRGQVTLPAYRGLYLDELLSGSQEVKVHRDSQFRSMVRNFKTLSESDYALPQGLEGVLRPYQQVGFQWLKTLEGYGFGGILADEMGLGKTLQMIAFLATVPYQTVGAPSLVVCPASLIYNWGDELARFAPQLRVQLILGSAGEREALRRDGVDWDLWVTSYELLRQDIEDYGKIHFYCCVLDEAQHIKNAATLASKAVKAIDCTQRFVLTGTPIENRLSELWNLFDFLMPGYLYTNHAFREKLEKPVLKAKSPEALEQLRRLVRPFVLRRLKGDVLKELPPKEEHIRRVSLSQEERKLYCACVQAAVTSLGEGQEKLKILAALTRLRQLCCDPELCFENYTGPASKLDACVELCEAMVENGHQILLFSQFTSMLERIRARLDDLHISSFTLQGSTSKEKRAALVKAFNGGEASVFLISLKAGGTGLNLTAADVVIHYDPWWNQAAQDQATDRAHRMGQQAHVQVYKLIAKDTIEEKILELQEKKTALLDAISGCEEAGILNMSGEELISLLKENL